MSNRNGRVVERKVQLYDLAADPFETKDLLQARPEDAKRLQAEFDAFLAGCKPSLYRPDVEQRHKAALAARANDPKLKDLKAATGSPGHWIGAGAKDRRAIDGVFPPLPEGGESN